MGSSFRTPETMHAVRIGWSRRLAPSEKLMYAALPAFLAKHYKVIQIDKMGNPARSGANAA